MAELRRILVIRFSAMGDVALLVPVLRSFVATHSDVEITIVTRPKFAPMFYDMERVIVFPADVDYTYTGFFGMRDLFKKLMRKGGYEVVIDAHDHLRTIILRSFFKLFGHHVVVFDKGRPEKKAFTRKENKTTTPLIHTVERYRRAFEKAGFDFPIVSPPYLALSDAIQSASGWFGYKKSVENRKWIGIAPFAAHRTKIWPLENYAPLMEHILKKMDVSFFMFGGGDKEVAYFETLRKQFPKNCEVIAGQLKLRQEVSLMQHLDLMLCVDSSNMHLAALAGVPLISIWGGTHPDAGFGPFRVDDNSILQIDRVALPCRPCSVYGKETCYVGGFPCLTRISVDYVADQIIKRIA
jgi:ADP-heptose:LPS heptosyltransferase